MKDRNLALVVGWMTGAVVCFSAAAIAVRLLASRLSMFEILTVRNGGGLLILLATAAVSPGLRGQLRPGPLPLHLVRNTTHFAGQYGWNYALTTLPLATVFALEFTAPVWLAALAVPLLGERMTVSRAGVIVLGLVGTLVILRPGLEAFQPAAIIMLGSALAFAATAVGTKALTRVVPVFTILLWMNLLQLPFSFAASDPAFLAKIGPSEAIGAVLLAVAGLASHLCLTQAYRNGDALLVMPLDFVRIPLSALIGWSFYGEVLDSLVFVGAALIIAGILWNLSAEARRSTPAVVTASRTPGSGPAS